MQDRYLRLIAHCLVLIVIMLGLIAAGLWFRLDQADSRAQAQDRGSVEAAHADLGLVRAQQVTQMEAMNKKMADLEQGFRNGSYTIQTIEPKGAAKPARREEPKE